MRRRRRRRLRERFDVCTAIREVRVHDMNVWQLWGTCGGRKLQVKSRARIASVVRRMKPGKRGHAMWSLKLCTQKTASRVIRSVRQDPRPPSFVSARLRREADRQREPQHREHRDAQTRRREGAQAPRVPRAPRVYNQQPFRRGSDSEPELATGTSSARSGGAELYAPPVNTTGNAAVRNANTPTMSGYPDISCTADRPIARPVHARERVLP